MALRQVVKNHRGEVISKADLPPANTTRWTSGRKALVVLGLRHGLLSISEAEKLHNLSVDELLDWEKN